MWELLWVVKHLHLAEGVFFKSMLWNYAHLLHNILQVYTNASGVGLAFWIPSLNLDFQSDLPSSVLAGTIVYFKALAVTAVLLDTTTYLHLGQHIAIFTDNMNTVSMFNSLAMLPLYNWLLMESVDAII